MTLIRPVRDLRKQVALYEVAISLPSIKATLSDLEYQLITSVAGENLAEARREPEVALWLQARHLPGPAPLQPPESDSDEDDTFQISQVIAARPPYQCHHPRRLCIHLSLISRILQRAY